MKTKLFTLAMLLTFSMAGNAKIKNSVYPVGVTYRTDFDGYEQWGIKYSTYNPKGLGVDGGFFFGEFKNINMTLNLGATYTYMLKNTRKYSLFFSVGAGPSLTIKSEKDNSKKYASTNTKFLVGAYANPQISYTRKAVVVSVGAYGEAPKLKFKKEDGAHLGLSVSLGYIF